MLKAKVVICGTRARTRTQAIRDRLPSDSAVCRAVPSRALVVIYHQAEKQFLVQRLMYICAEISKFALQANERKKAFGTMKLEIVPDSCYICTKPTKAIPIDISHAIDEGSDDQSR